MTKLQRRDMCEGVTAMLANAAQLTADIAIADKAKGHIDEAKFWARTGVQLVKVLQTINEHRRQAKAKVAR